MLCCIASQKELPGKDIAGTGAGFGQEAAHCCSVLCHCRRMDSQGKELVGAWENNLTSVICVLELLMIGIWDERVKLEKAEWEFKVRTISQDQLVQIRVLSSACKI